MPKFPKNHKDVEKFDPGPRLAAKSYGRGVKTDGVYCLAQFWC